MVKLFDHAECLRAFQDSRPGGTSQLSPARQRWVSVRKERVPEGPPIFRLRPTARDLSSRPPRTFRPGLSLAAPPELT
jgi:hypothetical protein